MASIGKVNNALASATSYLESAESALVRKDEGSFEDDIWHVGAELEYALFLFGILIRSRHEDPNRRSSSRRTEVEISRVLSEAKSQLRHAAEALRKEELAEAFVNASSARDQVLIIQRHLAKKRRKASRYK